MKSTFACSHQVVASCHVIPSTAERDGRLLESDELPKHVSEPQSPASLHPLQPAVLSSQLIRQPSTTVVLDSSVPKILDRISSAPLCPQHVEDDPFFEAGQSAPCLVPFGHHRIVQMCHRSHFALATTNVGAFQLKVSVDQDIAVIVAENQ